MFLQHAMLPAHRSNGLSLRWPSPALSNSARMHTQIPPDVDPHKPPKAPPPSIDPDPLPDDPIDVPGEAPEGDPPVRQPPLHASAMGCARHGRAIADDDRVVYTGGLRLRMMRSEARLRTRI